MKKKVLSLLLAIAMVCSLAACGGGKDPAPAEASPAEGAGSAASEEETPGENEDPASGEASEPEEVEMHYTFENGTLTCSGNGEVVREDWIEVVKNAIFDLDENACAQALEALVIEPGVTGVGDDAFSRCVNLSGDLSLPDSVTRIGGGAFATSGLSSVDLPDGVTEIGAWTFQDCKNLTSISLPKNLTKISGGLFAGCTALTDVEIPEGVTSIGGDAFYNCSIETIVIPDSVTGIGDRAFFGTLLKELTIPASVAGWDRQSLCTGPFLKDITILCDTSMDNVDFLLSGLFYNAEYMCDSDETIKHCIEHGFVDMDSLPVVTIHAPAGSVVEGYAKRQIETNQYMQHFTVEAI